MEGQHAWSGVVAGTTRDSFLVAGKLSGVPLQTSGSLVPVVSVLLGEERLHVLDEGADDGGRQLTA
jgi:hypothetical protein